MVRADTFEGGCPDCGVVSSRVHAWCRQRVKDVPHAGHLELVVVKLRLVWAEGACTRRAFSRTTSELPLRARCSSRLRRGLLEAVIDHGRGRRRCRSRVRGRVVDHPEDGEHGRGRSA